MKTFRPESWSKQARNMANNVFEQYKYYNQNTTEGNKMVSLYIDFEEVQFKLLDKYIYSHIFNESYKSPLIRRRAAKRFGRLCRKAGL